MSRHRRRRLHSRWGHAETYELRDVVNPVLPALAYRRDDGQIVVDVDEKLRGQDREDAIQAALLPFREGRLAGGPVALIAAIGEAAAKMTAGAQKPAVAVASAGTAAVLGLTTLVVTGAPEPGGHPAVVASTLRTVVAEPPPQVTLMWMPSPTVRASTTPVRPSSSTPPDAGKEPSRRPAAPREASEDSDRATPTPSARPRRTVEHRESEEPASADPPPKTQPAVEPTREAVEESREEESRSPVEELLPDVTVNTPPEPQPGPSGCGGVGVNVDLGNLGGVDVCLGKGA